MDDNFADTPKTISELRADRSGLAKDMTARDALVCLLRDLDNGKIASVDFVAICFARRVDHGILVNECCAGPHTALEMLGLLERCKMRLVADISS